MIFERQKEVTFCFLDTWLKNKSAESLWMYFKGKSIAWFLTYELARRIWGYLSSHPTLKLLRIKGTHLHKY